MCGWIKLHRALSKSDLWTSEPFTRGQAWADLLMLANHAPKIIRIRGVRVEINRGEVGWSEVKLAERWKWSRGKLRRFLSELKNDERIVQQADNITARISIINYDKYQCDDTPNDTAEDTTDGQQTVQQTDSKRYTNKNDKNDKNEKNNINTPLTPQTPAAPCSGKSERCASAAEESFSRFWELWPPHFRKTNKSGCLKKWKALKLHAIEGDILAGLEAWKQSEAWAKDDGQYIPMPMTWLNRRQWQDIDAAKASPFAPPEREPYPMETGWPSALPPNFRGDNEL